MRRLLRAVAAASVLLAAAGPAAPARAQAATAPEVQVVLGSISPWTGPTTPLAFRLALRNNGDAPLTGLSVQALLGDAVHSRSELTAIVEDPDGARATTPLGSWPATGVVVPPHQQVPLPPVTVRLPAPHGAGTEFGAVRPLVLRVRSRQGPGGRATTFTIWVSGRTVANPLQASLLVPLHEPTHRTPHGDFIDARLADLLGPQGSFGGIVATLAGPQPPKVTLVVDPLLVQEASAMAGSWTLLTRGGRDSVTVGAGDPRSRTAAIFLQRLRTAASHLLPAAFPYAQADMPALVHAGPDSKPLKPIGRGQSLLRDQLSRVDTGLAWPVQGGIDTAVLTTLADASFSTVVLDQASLPVPAPIDETQNATVDLGAGFGLLQRALVGDQGLSAALADPREAVEPAIWAQRVLAETAAAWLEHPGGSRPLPRGILLAPPQSWRPHPAFFRALAGGLARAPWLRLESATELAARVPPGPDERRRTLAAPTAAQLAAELPASHLRRVAQAGNRLTSFLAAVGTEAPPLTDDADTDLLIAQSADWRAHGRVAPRGLAFVNQVNRDLNGIYHRVHIESGRVSITSRNGHIPITVQNDADLPLTVELRLSSPKVDLAGPAEPFTLPAHRSRTETVLVQARATGTSTVRVSILTPDGRDMIAASDITVVSTAFSRVALVLTGGAAGFLLLWWSRRLRRQRRPPAGRHMAPDPPGPPAPEPAVAAVAAVARGAPAGLGEAPGRVSVTSGAGGAVPPAVPPAEGGEEQPAEPSLARSTALMAVGTLLSRVTGMLRVIVLAGVLGVAEGKLADVYNVANTTPNIVYELVLGGILSSIFVPVFVEVQRIRGKEQAWHVARSVMTVAFATLGLLSLVTMLAAPLLIKVYIHGGTQDQADAQRLGGQLLLMFMPQIVFYGVGAVMTGLLNANRRFGVPMFAPILNNLVVIVIVLAFHLLVGDKIPNLARVTLTQKLLLGVGTTAGVVAMTMVQWPFLRRIGFRYRPVWDLRDPAIRKMAKLSAFTVGYVVVNQLGYLVVPILANAVTGGYTAYSYAFIFFQLPHGVFAVSVITALLPRMSENAVARNWVAFRAAVSQGIRLTALVLLPASIGYVVLARPIVRLLLVHGVIHRGGESELLLVRVLTVFVLGLVSFSTFQLILRAYYALQDTKTPLKVNIVAVGTQTLVNVVLFAVLPRQWKVVGLAIGHASSYTVGSALLLVLLSRRIGGLDGRRVLAAVGRMLVAGLLMGGVTWAVSRGAGRVLPQGLFGDLGIVAGSVLAGLATYLAAARALRIEELRQLFGIVQRRTTATRA